MEEPGPVTDILNLYRIFGLRKTYHLSKVLDTTEKAADSCPFRICLSTTPTGVRNNWKKFRKFYDSKRLIIVPPSMPIFGISIHFLGEAPGGDFFLQSIERGNSLK